MVSTTTTTIVSVPVLREEVLALTAGTLCAFVLLRTLTTRSHDDGMFWAEDDVAVIIQIFASRRGIITMCGTLITYGFSLILPLLLVWEEVSSSS